MRTTLVLLPLSLCAAPALAQPLPPPPPPPAFQLPPELTDPATADRLTDAMQSLSQALLDMRVGNIKAAVEGRRATPGERRMTVGDLARRDEMNPDAIDSGFRPPPAPADRGRPAQAPAGHQGNERGASAGDGGPAARRGRDRTRAREHARSELSAAVRLAR